MVMHVCMNNKGMIHTCGEDRQATKKNKIWLVFRRQSVVYVCASVTLTTQQQQQR
jgi:hypothetical protein